MEFIENQLVSINVNEFPQLVIHHLKSDNSIISPITIEWQKVKCDLLGIQFQQQTDQHSSLEGQVLGNFEHWRPASITGDGNCLFRCLSKVISGSEEDHAKLRGEICRYMLDEGKDEISWYFSQVLSTTPAEYLTANYHDYYEPVTAMMNSLTPTFYKDDKSDQIINID